MLGTEIEAQPNCSTNKNTEGKWLFVAKYEEQAVIQRENGTLEWNDSLVAQNIAPQ